MVPQSRLQEFGFSDAGKFPQRLIHHAVLLSLPSAMDNGIDPLEVIVEDGLVIPLQLEGGSGGMIVQNDGRMLYVGHRDPANFKSPLEFRFIKEIPYDARIEVSNIMQRAVLADPSLMEIWDKVSLAWMMWFPGADGEGALMLMGEFKHIAQAWNMIGDLTGQLTSRASKNVSDPGKIRIIVQSDKEFKRGWLGEEFVVDEVMRRTIREQGLTKYLLQRLFPKMQKVLSSPIFFAGSVFRLYSGLRSAYIIKLVVVSLEGQDRLFPASAGVDLTLDAIDGFSPSVNLTYDPPVSGADHG